MAANDYPDLQRRNELIAQTWWKMRPDLFAAHLDKSYRLPRHIKYMGEILARCAQGGQRIIMTVSVRHGKALALDTPIATPRGWTTMGMLRPGDQVFGDDGKPCSVVAVSPVWRDREVFSVETSDGDRIIADADHEWLFRKDGSGRFKVGTTRDLRSGVVRQAAAIVATEPLQLPESRLPIHPYVLGAWLGDGDTAASPITNPDPEVMLRVGIEEGGVKCVNRGGCPRFRPGPNCRDEGVHQRDTMQHRLRVLGVLGSKHIPMAYKRASVDQRMDLLRGLVDTDGYVGKDGQVEYCSTSSRLAEDVLELVRSLGVKAVTYTGDATIDGLYISPRYRVSFYMNDAATVDRKLKRCRDTNRSRMRYVRRVEPAGRTATVCIEVDSPSNMFLCGRSMLPTHNSLLSTRWLPSWYLELFPNRSVAIACHTAEFAADWGKDVRNTLNEHKDQLSVKISKDSTAAHSWRTSGGGRLHTNGVGGEFEGRGYHCMILDDPIKDFADAHSDTARKNLLEWYKGTFRMRMEPGGNIIIVMSRWHYDDLVGTLLREMDEPWTHINLPALAEENDPLGRSPGDPLWPERFTTRDFESRYLVDREAYGGKFEHLEDIRSAILPQSWLSRFQQRPALESGGLFKREDIRYYEDMGDHYLLNYEEGRQRRVLKHDCWRFISADTAQEEKKRSDFTARGVWDVERVRRTDGGHIGGLMILVDLWKARAEVPDVESQLRRDLTRWNPNFIGIEKSPQAAHLIQRLIRDGLPVFGVRPVNDKVTRATNAQIWAANHKLWLPRNAPWLAEFEEELLRFPSTVHDDCVDMLSVAVNMAADRDMWRSPETQRVEYPRNTYGALFGHGREKRKPKGTFYMDRQSNR